MTPGPGTYSSESSERPSLLHWHWRPLYAWQCKYQPRAAAYAPGMPGTTWPAYSLGGTERRKRPNPSQTVLDLGAYSLGWASQTHLLTPWVATDAQRARLLRTNSRSRRLYAGFWPQGERARFSMASGSKGVLEAMERSRPARGDTPSSSTVRGAVILDRRGTCSVNWTAPSPAAQGPVHTRQRATRTTHRPLQWRARPARRNREFLWDRVLGLDHTHQARRRPLPYFPW